MSETDDKTTDSGLSSDLLYGVLSVVNQFSSVLRERGKEYRASREGKVLGEQIETMYQGLGDREKSMLDVVLASLDGLASAIRGLDQSLKDAGARGAGPDGANGQRRGGNGEDKGQDREGRDGTGKPRADTLTTQ
jgi:hypothetical protein